MYSVLSLERKSRPRIALPLSYAGMLPAAGFESAYYRGCRVCMLGDLNTVTINNVADKVSGVNSGAHHIWWLIETNGETGNS